MVREARGFASFWHPSRVLIYGKSMSGGLHESTARLMSINPSGWGRLKGEGDLGSEPRVSVSRPAG